MRSWRVWGGAGALALCSAFGWPQGGGTDEPSRRDQIDELATRSDPLEDDWETEILSARAGEVLHVLVAAVAADRSADVAAWVVSGSTCRALALPGGELHELGDVVLRRVARPVPDANVDATGPAPVLIAAALRDWIAPVDTGGAGAAEQGANAPRVHFKIVEVSAATETSFETTSRVTLAARRQDREIQQNASWRIHWELREGVEAPLIRGIEVLRFEEVSAPEALFAECTGSVLPTDAALQAQLGRGGEHWFGKIDALGEWNFFGHNGIAIGDADGDGFDDVYVAMGTGLPNKLFLRQADGSVRERALESGVAWLDDTKGVLFLDHDNDGDQDLFCAMGPTIVLSENDGEGHFTPARSLRAATDAAFYSLAAADYDLDGDLDLYATRYVKSRYGESLPIPFHDAQNGPRNHLLRNDHPDGFADVTDRVGLGAGNNRFSLAASWEDYDLDGDPDLYVANDFGRNNLYRNDDGLFVDVAAETGTEDMSAGMGASWADVDLDGDADLLVSNMFSAAGQRVAYQPRFERERDDSAGLIQRHTLGNTLLLNDGEGGFRDVSERAGVRMGRWAWGSILADLTGDGYPDMAVPNGFLTNARDDDL